MAKRKVASLTVPPLIAKAVAMARPIPVPPPVTIETVSLTL
jgi:hypothetical protein